MELFNKVKISEAKLRKIIRRSLLEQSQPDLTVSRAKSIVRDLYNEVPSNPGMSPPKAKKIHIELEEDDEGDFYWFGEIQDQDGSTVEFSMPDHYPDAADFYW